LPTTGAVADSSRGVEAGVIEQAMMQAVGDRLALAIRPQARTLNASSI